MADGSPARDEARSAPVSREEAPLELSVVIPCLNEAGTIARVVGVAMRALREGGIAGEVVVSDNGSTDGSQALAAGAGARVVHCPVRGYGAALQWGFRHARGTHVLMGDADLSYDFGLAPRFMARAREGAPFVMGTRLGGTIDPGAMPLLHRYLGTPVLTWVLNRLFGTRISDCNCGMRCLHRRTLLGLGVVSPGMEYASEMVVKAAIAEVPIAEVPIEFHRDQRDRRPHLQTWRDGWRHLRLLMWHAPDHMLTLPGLVLLAIGLPMVLALLGGPLHVGGLTFDLHYLILGLTLSLLGASATSIGLVVHAAVPAGRVRRARVLGKIAGWFTFDGIVKVGALLLAAGLAADGMVLWNWLAIDRAALGDGSTRMSLFGVLLMAMGFQMMVAALLLGTTKSATAPDLLAGHAGQGLEGEGTKAGEGGAQGERRTAA